MRIALPIFIYSLLGIFAVSVPVNAGDYKIHKDPSIEISLIDHVPTISCAITIGSHTSSDSRESDKNAEVFRASDNLIQVPVIEFSNNVQAFSNTVDIIQKSYSSSSLASPRQYSLLRILFHAIIAPNAP